MITSPQATNVSPHRFQARSVRSSASSASDELPATCRGAVGRHPEPSTITSTKPMTATTATTIATTSGNQERGSGAVVPHRLLVVVPLPVAHRRDHHAQRDERQADEPSAPREVERKAGAG